MEQIEMQTEMTNDQQHKYLELSFELGMPIVPIELRSEIESFTNRFNNNRVVPYLTLFNNTGDLLCDNVLPELLQHETLSEIKSNWLHWLTVVSEGREA